MNRIYSFAVLCLVIALVLAGVACASTSPGGMKVAVSTIDLEDVTPADINRRMGTTPAGQITFSPDGKRIALGSEKGYVRVIEPEQAKVSWEKRVAEGTVEALSFSLDGNFLLVGEGSPDGFIYCYDLRSGTEKWRYRTADDIGGTRDAGAVVRAVAAAPEGRVFATSSRRWKEGKKTVYASKVYRFDLETGKKVWALPERGNFDLTVAALGASADGKVLAFAKGPLSGKDPLKAEVRRVDAESGKLSWSYTIPGLEPHFPGSGLWAGLDVSPDGRYVGAFVSFGQAYFFDSDEIARAGRAEPKWRKDISTPLEVGGAILYAYGARTRFVGDRVLFQTSQTYSLTHVYPQKPAVDHPNANSLFAYDLEGNLRWKHYIGGGSTNQPVQASRDGRYLAVALGLNEVTRDLGAFGGDVLDTRAGAGAVQVVKQFSTEGPVVAAAISPDGETLAAVETPLQLEDKSVVGRYRLHIFPRR